MMFIERLKKRFTPRFLAECLIALALFSGVVYYNGRPPANAPALSDVKSFKLMNLQGSQISTSDLHKPTVFVFWATWCGPCKVELARIQRLVASGSIAKDAVIAVSVGEERADVEKAVSERGYTFEIALDHSRAVAMAYAVNVTPTILLRNADGTVAWRTSGISPTLELRLLRFLNQKT